MRAAVLTEVNKPLQILDLEQEGPKAGEVRVEVKAAGVCMSDWHIMNGDWPLPLPMVLGHEAAGVVAEVGAEVHNVKRGDHVIFSFRPNCGYCRYCASGRTVLCIGRNDTPRWVMHDGTTRIKLNGEPVNQMARIGTFSEYVVCPAEQVVKVREDLPWTHAAIIGCSVATGVGAVVRHAEVEAGASVLVIGCGGEIIACHPRSYEREEVVFDPLHYLPLIEKKINAFDQAAPLQGWELPEAFTTMRRLMEARMGKQGRRAYVQVLRLLESFDLADLHAAVKQALHLGAISFDAVKHLEAAVAGADAPHLKQRRTPCRGTPRRPRDPPSPRPAARRRSFARGRTRRCGRRRPSRRACCAPPAGSCSRGSGSRGASP